jgi:pyridoxamine 5'-phosphate oxidase
MVLLKGYDEIGFRFFTNYQSNKSNDIDNNKNVALNFHWKSLQRQIRIEGLIEKLNKEQSDEYYNTRHYMSRIGAWASDQSRPLKNREELEKKILTYKSKYPDENNVPRPPYWGGYLIKPKKFEFWQDMPHRIHQREVFELNNKEWTKYTLSP